MRYRAEIEYDGTAYNGFQRQKEQPSIQEAFELAARLRQQRINISVTTPASARLDSRFAQQQNFARASVHYFNNEDEVERFCRVLSFVNG